LLFDLNKTKNITLLIVTHDPDLAARCDREIHIKDGRLVETGAVCKFFDLLLTANQSLLRNKARTILTIIAIFIGATTLSLTNGIGAGYQDLPE